MRGLFLTGMTLLCGVHAADGSPADLSPSATVPTRASTHLQVRNDDGLHFTLKEAEAYALANHPQIAAAKLLSLIHI